MGSRNNIKFVSAKTAGTSWFVGNVIRKIKCIKIISTVQWITWWLETKVNVKWYLVRWLMKVLWKLMMSI